MWQTFKKFDRQVVLAGSLELKAKEYAVLNGR